MMKQTNYLAAFLILCMLTSLPLAQSETVRPPEPIVSLRINKTPYEIGRPASWVQGTAAQGPRLLASWVPPRATLFPNLNVTLEPAPAEGEKGVEQLFNKLGQILPGFKVEEAGWQEINGIRGHRSTTQWDSIYGRMKAIRFLIPYEGEIVAITLVDFEPRFALSELTFNLCVNALAPFEEVKTGFPR